jgi:hypothetical protein
MAKQNPAPLSFKLVAQPVFLAYGTFCIFLGGNITATVTFVIPEILCPLGGLWYFKPEFHFIVSLMGLTKLHMQLPCQ